MMNRAIAKLALGASANVLGLSTAAAALAADSNQVQAEASASGGDIVVTAQRRDELARDVPISITALSGETLAKAGVVNTMDIGKVAPGVSLPLYGAFLLPSIRGISSNGAGLGDSPNVAIYVDGVYVASQSGLNADLPDVQSVEVLKGPQGALYGQNAAGGAIIINTIAPKFDLEGKLAASYGNFDDKSVNGYVTGPLGQSVAFQASASYHDRGGVNRDLLRGGHDNGLRAASVRGKLLFQASDTASLLVQGYYSKHNDTGVYSNAALNGNSAGIATQALLCPAGSPCASLPIATRRHTFTTNILPDTRIRSYGFSGRGKLEFPEVGTLSVLAAYNNTLVLNQSDSDQALVNISDFTLHIKEHDAVGELNFASEKFGGLSFNAGLFYLHKAEAYDPYYFANFLISGVPTVYPALPGPGVFAIGQSTRYDKKSYAAYLEVSYDISDQLSLTAGGRYAHEKHDVASIGFFVPHPLTGPALTPLPDPRGGHTFNKFTPRVVLRFKPDNDNTLYASYSKGFKSGYVDPNNINAQGCFAVACLHPVVKPETVDAFEAGYKGKIAGILDLTLAAFHYKYKNIQVFSFSPPAASFYQNAASGKITGFEFGTSMQATPELSLGFNGTYLDAKYQRFPAATVFTPTGFGNAQAFVDAGGNPLMRTPKWSFNGSMNYETETDAGTFGAFLSASYKSGMTFDVGNRVRQGGYALLDGELSFAPSGFSGARLVVWGKNLTNKAYLQSVLESQLGDAGSYADPRTYGVRVEYRF